MIIIEFVVELLGISVSLFGLYGVVISLRFVLPCFIMTTVSSILSNAEQALALAVASGAIPEVNEYRGHLETYAYCVCNPPSRRSDSLAQPCWRVCPYAH
jgi:hypothetical protein